MKVRIANNFTPQYFHIRGCNHFKFKEKVIEEICPFLGIRENSRKRLKKNVSSKNWLHKYYLFLKCIYVQFEPFFILPWVVIYYSKELYGISIEDKHRKKLVVIALES